MSITISKDMTAVEMQIALGKLPAGNLLHTAKYWGAIKLTEYPLAYQKRIRDEWKEIALRKVF